MTMTTTSGLKSWSTVYRDGSTPVTTVTETVYGPNGSRTVTTTNPDGSSTVNAYQYGRLQSVTRKDSGGSQVSQTVYTYDAFGRVASTTDARNGATTYTYNNAGDLQTIDYSDTTPDVSYTYDRRGRRLTAVCNGITTTWTYNDANQPLTESYSGGTLAGLSMNWVYDNKLRLSTLTAKNGASTLQTASYTYDTAGRLQTVTDSPYTATYTYHPNSTLINTVTFANNGATRLVTTRVYDKLNRLTSISSVTSGPSAPSLPVSFGYQYNSANQRTRMLLADGSWWEYRYDALGQVV